jgi:ribosomal protein S18 acetylase RimI-like enzyme
MEKINEINDSAVIMHILNMSFMTVAIQFNFTKEKVPFFPAFITEDIIKEQLNNGLKMFGYDDSGKTVACGGYSQYKDDIYLVERLATLPDYRHYGIGRKLMDFIENKIREDGGKTAEVHVVSINQALIEWYKKLNYKVTRYDVISDKYKNLPFDICVMNKIMI